MLELLNNNKNNWKTNNYWQFFLWINNILNSDEKKMQIYNSIRNPIEEFEENLERIRGNK